MITEEPYCQKENCSQPKERGNVVATPSSPADPFAMFVPDEHNFLWLQFSGPHSAPDSSAINLQPVRSLGGGPGTKNIVQTGMVMA